ncbi:RNA-binding cell elongation regulator Jag/EloR [uncultured Oscillibacter sp.]|uniref:RNA-binding cell elongation regulator Jag/EloR n=1 Tax=uncultured Oscillibacter sp. TaxID=876091 RepID=UPI0025D1E71D|nr:RNA-binding cell elongation regulator Jag/EloR [uncultured Oscillibacter sp.]
MREFIDVTGKTEEEAISKALAQLGLDRDDVSVEILERAKSGFLGIGSSPARVRVYHGPEDGEKTAPKAEAKPEPEPRQETKKEFRPEPKPRREKPRKQEPREDRPAAPRAEAPRPAPVPVDLGEEVDDEKSRAIRTFLTGLLEHMECSAEIRVYQPEKGRYKVILEGKQMGTLIGRRGETLDAIQQLTSYSVNRSGGSRVRVQLDAEGYREKREQSLQHLAKKVAGKVVKYRRSVTLEPMNAYERHVIHTALQDVPGVTTYSTGTEPNRRVIVAYDRTTH